MKRLNVSVLSILTSILFSQGLTTSGGNGFIKSQDGKGLVGTNIVATHIPSGTQYGTTSMNNGYFAITNMKIGGPYKIAISFIGFQDQNQSGIYLKLGQDERVDFSLSTEAVSYTHLTLPTSDLV